MIIVPALIVQDERLGSFLQRRFGRLVPPDAEREAGRRVVLQDELAVGVGAD